MSIASAISSAQQRVANAYTAVSNKGGTLPATQNLTNLPTAINSIPAGSAVLAKLIAGPQITDRTYTPPPPFNGFSSVEISGVTSDIDSNIQAGNIKSGVTILGVTGTYAPTQTFVGVPVSELGGTVALGVLSTGTITSFDFSGVTEIASYGLRGTFYRRNGGGAVTMPDLTKINEYGMLEAFMSCGITSFTANALTTLLGYYPLKSAFQASGVQTVTMNGLVDANAYHCCEDMCRAANMLTTINMTGLQTISAASGCEGICRSASRLTTINIPNLKTISGENGLAYGFLNTGVTSYTFSTLDTITGSKCLQNSFAQSSIQTLSFPALKSTSFGSYTNQFYNMLRSVTGCTVHFPSNIQSVIGSWSDVTGGFGGTNTTVLFDLPATE